MTSTTRTGGGRRRLPEPHSRTAPDTALCYAMKKWGLVATLVLVVSAAVFMLGARFGTSAAAQTKAVSLKPADVDRLLAPVALYPDQLLAQMLLCTADTAQVTKLATWLKANASLKGTDLQDQATVDGFEASFVALTLFPQVVNYMATQLEWTTNLGVAFKADKTAVFDSIQRLRKQAQESGALKDTPQQAVDMKTTSSGQQVIVIEPANPQVVYVPQYNPQVVYTQPATVVVEKDDDSDAAVAGIIGFTAGIAIGASMNNNYYYGPYGWGGGAYMYNDAWDDYYDAREDAREDWTDHREDLVEERGDRARDSQEQRTERAEGRQETRTDTQGQRTDRQQTRQDGQARTQTQAATQSASSAAGTQPRAQTQSATTATRGSGSSEARGYGGGTAATNVDRSGTKSDAFSGYSSGGSERAASARGQSSRGSSRGGGGGGGRRR
jgi:hypothetical protein